MKAGALINCWGWLPAFTGRQFIVMYRYETRTIYGKLHSLFFTASKRALFFASMPVYWLVVFRLVNWFDARFFAFVVAASIVMSHFGHGWGMLEMLAH